MKKAQKAQKSHSQSLYLTAVDSNLVGNWLKVEVCVTGLGLIFLGTELSYGPQIQAKKRKC